MGTVVYGARNTLLGADGSWIAMLPRGEAGNGQACSCSSGSDAPPNSGASAEVTIEARAPATWSPVPGAPARPHPFHPDLVVRRGVLAEECAALMKGFFARRRKEAAAAKAAAAGSSSGDDGGRSCIS